MYEHNPPGSGDDVLMAAFAIHKRTLAIEEGFGTACSNGTTYDECVIDNLADEIDVDHDHVLVVFYGDQADRCVRVLHAMAAMGTRNGLYGRNNSEEDSP